MCINCRHSLTDILTCRVTFEGLVRMQSPGRPGEVQASSFRSFGSADDDPAAPASMKSHGAQPPEVQASSFQSVGSEEDFETLLLDPAEPGKRPAPPPNRGFSTPGVQSSVQFQRISGPLDLMGENKQQLQHANGRAYPVRTAYPSLRFGSSFIADGLHSGPCCFRSSSRHSLDIFSSSRKFSRRVGPHGKLLLLRG
jgi:hypothetical protein